MRSFFIGSLALGLVGALTVGCGDSGTTSTGTGGGSTGGNGTGGTTTNSGGGGTGGQAACTQISYDKIRGTQIGTYSADLAAFGAADPDSLNLQFYPTDMTTSWSGSIDLASAENANYQTCSTCVLVAQDTPDGAAPAKLFFQTAGTVDLGTAMLSDQDMDVVPISDGSFTGLKLVEVTIDPDTFESTPVPGGACLELASAPITMPVPPAGWTCSAAYYDDDAGCDCNCGVIDEDCTDTTQTVYGCQAGQTCDATTATCAGLPTAWTCPADQFNGGAANGCDCNCGAHDPDCDLMPAETVEGCATGESCTPGGKCLPAAWSCNPSYFEDMYCDCGCGVADSACADATKASCDFCDNDGSCDTVACDDAASKINATNNAVCN
jgi:hypothetical protein